MSTSLTRCRRADWWISTKRNTERPGWSRVRSRRLWIAKPVSATSSPAGESPNLRIHATLNGSDLTVQREVSGGPGLSVIDMPEAGCWTFSLAWSGNRDQLAVPYSG